MPPAGAPALVQDRPPRVLHRARALSQRRPRVPAAWPGAFFGPKTTFSDVGLKYTTAPAPLPPQNSRALREQAAYSLQSLEGAQTLGGCEFSAASDGMGVLLVPQGDWRLEVVRAPYARCIPNVAWLCDSERVRCRRRLRVRGSPGRLRGVSRPRTGFLPWPLHGAGRVPCERGALEPRGGCAPRL